MQNDAWLLHPNTARELESFRRGFVPTAAQLAEFNAAAPTAEAAPRNLRTAGSEAEIVVDGVLTKGRNLFVSLFAGGNCSYSEIRAALAMADADPNIKRATLLIDSPGGQCAGLLETIQAIEAFSKPITARCSAALSAAYALAAACDRVEAFNPSSEFGCLGVAVTIWVPDDEITITNTESPEKRPDPSTPEGKASIVRYLDAINGWFTGAIARGRTAAGKAADQAKVNAEFGRGAVLLAADARKRGMIDGMVAQRSAGGSSSARAEHAEEPIMSASSSEADHTWDGKPFRELKPGERAAFKKAEPERYNRARDEHQRDYVLGRAFSDLPPLARVRLRNEQPELYQRLRTEAIAAGKWSEDRP